MLSKEDIKAIAEEVRKLKNVDESVSRDMAIKNVKNFMGKLVDALNDLDNAVEGLDADTKRDIENLLPDWKDINKLENKIKRLK